ncbi:MAG: aminopeptidase P family N-terminal domain-containing protein, partial [Actinomycetota bacterium]
MAQFADIDYASRVASLRQRLPLGNGCDAVLLLDLVDLRWLTGFTGSNGWAVLRADDLVLGTDGRYRDRAAAETAASGATVVAETDRAKLHERLVDALRSATRVALDPGTTAYARWTSLDSDVSLEPTDSLVRVQR